MRTSIKAHVGLRDTIRFLLLLSLILLSLLARPHLSLAASSATILNEDEIPGTETVDVYVQDTLRFTVESDEEPIVRVSKYAAPDSSDKVEMDASPTLSEGVYELPLTVTNNGQQLTDFTPGNYVIDVLENEAVTSSTDFNILSRFTDVNVEVNNADQLFLHGDLTFTTTYKLKDNENFESSPQTAPSYEAYVSIHEEHSDGGQPGNSLFSMREEGDFTNYSLNDGVYTVHLNEDTFTTGTFYIIVYKVTYDGQPPEIDFGIAVENLSQNEFTVKDIVSADISPDSINDPELGDSFDFTTSFEVTDGTNTETVSTVPDGLMTLNVYINGNGLTPLEPAEGQTMITNNGDGNYTLYVNPDLFEENTFYSLALEEDTDDLVKPEDSLGFTVAEGHLVSSITENLSADLVPAFSATNNNYTLEAQNSEAFVTFDVQVPDETTELSISAEHDNQPTVNGNLLKAGLAVGSNKIQITATNEDGSVSRTYTVTVNRASAPDTGDGGDDEPSGGGGGGGGGGGAPDNGTPSSGGGDFEPLSDEDEEEVNPNECKVYELDQDTNFSAIVGHWAEVFVKSLLSTRLVGPETAGVFGPNNLLTRAEATKMLFCLSGYTYQTGLVGFTDSEAHPMADLIATARARNVINGYGDGSFKPYAPVSRAEFLAIVFNAKAIFANPVDDDYFEDVVKGTWYEKIVNYAFEKGIIHGVREGVFAPHNTITRAEAAKIIYLTNQQFPNNGS